MISTKPVWIFVPYSQHTAARDHSSYCHYETVMMPKNKLPVGVPLHFVKVFIKRESKHILPAQLGNMKINFIQHQQMEIL
jgi:hypothetical protein